MSIDGYRGTARAELEARDQIIRENAKRMWAAASSLADDISRSIKASSVPRHYEAYWEREVSGSADPDLTCRVAVTIKGEDPLDRSVVGFGLKISKSMKNAPVMLRGQPLTGEAHLQALTFAEQAIARKVEERNLKYGSGCAAAIAILLTLSGALPVFLWY